MVAPELEHQPLHGLRELIDAELVVVAQIRPGGLDLLFEYMMLFHCLFVLCFFCLGGLDLLRSGEKCKHNYKSITGKDMGGSTSFVTTASTETLKGTILGVTCFPPLPVPKVTPKIVPFSKQLLTIYCHSTNKVETPI